MRRFWLVVALALGTRASAAEADVRVAGGRVEIKAVAAPVSQILDRLSQQTGMRVIYDGAPPRAVVSITRSYPTPAAAVMDVLLGLGLNYALMLDPTGTRVQTLMMVASSGGSAPAVPARPTPPMMPAMPTPPPELAPDQDEKDEEELPARQEMPRRPGGPPGPGMAPPPGVLPPGPTFMPGQPFTVTPMPLQPPSPAPSPQPPQ
ncbi:MAG TPA: hypothetical protein VGL15_09615 [Vicinamibacteria bacterium]|jgi:hypothetical protein